MPPGPHFGTLEPSLTVTLFDASLTSPVLLEQHLETRLRDKKFTTHLSGGFFEFTATLDCSRTEAMSWTLNYPLARLVVSEGTVKVWEGRVEEMQQTRTGLSITALGYWSSLWDQIFYTVEATYETGSHTIEEIVQDILETNGPHIAADYSHIDATGVNMAPTYFMDISKYAGDSLLDLVERTPDNTWYAAVWEDRRFWLFEKDKGTIHWRPFYGELESADVGWSIDTLRNRIRVRYQDGATADTAWGEDTDSETRWSVTREWWPNISYAPAAVATGVRDKYLATHKYMPIIGRLVVKDMLRDGSGVWSPAWRVRAGQVIHIPDLTPGYESLDLAEDPRTLYIVQTEYDMETGVLTITPESPERRI